MDAIEYFVRILDIKSISGGEMERKKKVLARALDMTAEGLVSNAIGIIKRSRNARTIQPEASSEGAHSLRFVTGLFVNAQMAI